MSAARSYGTIRTAIATASRPFNCTTTELIQRRGFGARPAQWTCPSCLQETRQRKNLIAERASRKKDVFRRAIFTTLQRRDENRKPIDPTTTSSPSPPISPEPAHGEAPKLQRITDSEPGDPSKLRQIDTDPEPSSLPSETAQQRWHSSQRLSHLMDTLLARASIASQRINTYTGTDYTGIEALRTRIIDQESSVKERHSAVENARSRHREAHAKQSGAQKEIVSLLERKSSWSPGDLERYMGLVRSEHSLEADVSTAKDDLQAAERELEESRSKLERLERKQYHEEQIWSDTIRRNSTWVTFGLMGVNIVLLLAQIAIFEPYRRRKIVREVKSALDEKAAGTSTAGGSTAVAPARTATSTAGGPQIQKVDWGVDENGQPTVKIHVWHPDPGASEQESTEMTPTGQTDEPSKASLAESEGEALSAGAAKVERPSTPAPPAPPQHPETWTGSWETALENLQDLFSERIVQVKKVDVTTMALQGAATGFAAMGLLFVMFRPR